MAAGRTDLLPLMRLACAKLGAAIAAMVIAITEAVVRKDVFTGFPEKWKFNQRVM
jgi:hypothetical protein